MLALEGAQGGHSGLHDTITPHLRHLNDETPIILRSEILDDGRTDRAIHKLAPRFDLLFNAIAIGPQIHLPECHFWEGLITGNTRSAHLTAEGLVWVALGGAPSGAPPASVCPRIAINMPLIPSPLVPTWTFGTNFCAFARAAVKTSGCAFPNRATVSNMSSNWRSFTVASGPSTPTCFCCPSEINESLSRSP